MQKTSRKKPNFLRREISGKSLGRRFNAGEHRFVLGFPPRFRTALHGAPTLTGKKVVDPQPRAIQGNRAFRRTGKWEPPSAASMADIKNTLNKIGDLDKRLKVLEAKGR